MVPTSILVTIRNAVTGSNETHFDTDLIFFTNTAFMALSQIGVGSKKGFVITDDSLNWSDFTEDPILVEIIKGYLILKVQAMFDPTANSIIMESRKQVMLETEWRIREYLERFSVD